MRMKYFLLLLVGGMLSVSAQEYFPTNSGVKTEDNQYRVFTNATLHVSPTETVENATLVIRGNRITAAGSSVEIPKGSVITNLNRKHIYPSFIDVFSHFGTEKPKAVSRGSRPQYESTRDGYYWNDHILADRETANHFAYNDKQAKDLLGAGFGVVNTHVPDGIIRGTGMLVALNSGEADNERILDARSAQFLSFERSATSNQAYPSSLMGAMALLRQVYNDASWYKRGGSKTKDLSLEAVNRNASLPQIFDAGDKYNALRAAKIAKEFGLNYIIKGKGNELERAEELAATGSTLILPLNFPKPYDVSDPYFAGKISLADMRQWNQAPYNPVKMAEAGVRFALTTADTDKPATFMENLRKAIAAGLTERQALEALTTIPASLVGKENELGVLKPGAYANFQITSEPVFSKDAVLYEHWVMGDQHKFADMSIPDIRGTYTLTASGKTYEVEVNGDAAKPQLKMTRDSVKIASKLEYKDGWIHLFFQPEGTPKGSFTRLSALAGDSDTWNGSGVSAAGETLSWNAKRTKAFTPKEDSKSDQVIEPMIPVSFPNKSFGLTQAPIAGSVLFKNATVWTSEDAGILENTDVLVENGRISRIGQNLSAGSATVIDATGKHLTAGIIDEHSHIAAASINEGGQNSSAEVTIEDVVDADDADIYRNLSGGVTTVQILHGSANPIGGRSAIIKLRWGAAPEDLIIEKSPKFIKFALGENVKQSNWGSQETIRFPQTRMGVEQVFTDYFTRAKEYDEAWKAYNNLSERAKRNAEKPRYDAEMQTLAEILNGERFISCHSYVQSEINMLMKVAEKFGFRVNTFTHILEGYKVADKMAEHGVGGSTFSDWWAYKYEVIDAIPYNAAIMHREGVVTAINSDDAEMSRRLNQEAAKTMKYGGMTEEEAWKMVTINPAKLLHIDDRTGSIKEGKDADLVLWSEHPLSIYAIAEKTLVDGKVYYDYKAMQQQVEAIDRERNTLVNQMLAAKNSGMETRAPEAREEEQFHCDTDTYQK